MAHTTLVALDSGESICVGVVFTCTVFHLEVEFLQLFKPSGNLPLWVFKLLNSFQSSMICSYKEWASQQIRSEVAKEVHQGQ